MSDSVADGLPSYDELPLIEKLGIRHSWGLLPESLGTLGFLGAEARRTAAHAVTTGESLSLNLSTGEFDPPLFGRAAVAHTVFESSRNIFEDELSDFNPQSTSQWDGFLHIRAREFGWYGGVTDEAEAGATLGIQRLAAQGVVGRGVLVDVPRARAAEGREWDPLAGDVVEAHEIAAILAAREVELQRGDILCVRLGWLQAYRQLVAGGTADLAAVGDRFSGVASNDAFVRYLWDNRIAAIASDNPAVESAPGDPRNGSLHRKLIPGLGMPFAELLDLDLLADRCAASGRDTFLFAAAPLPLTGGTSSTANALALL